MNQHDPSDFQETMKRLRESIKARLDMASQTIVNEEVEKILGRVKVFVSNDLKGQFSWWIEKGGV